MKGKELVSLKRVAVSMLALLMLLAYIPIMNTQSAHAKEKKLVKLSDEQAEFLGFDSSEDLSMTEENIAELNEIMSSEASGEEEDVPQEDEEADTDTDLQLQGGSPATPDSDGFYKDSEKFGAFMDQTGLDTFKPDDVVSCDITQEGQIITFLFTPESDGAFKFWSSGDMDTIGRVCQFDVKSGTYKQINDADNDEQSGEDSNFSTGFIGKAGVTYVLQARIWYDDSTGQFDLHLRQDLFSASINVTVDSKGKATVTGSAEGDTFNAIYVDGDKCLDLGDVAEIPEDTTFSMKNYSVGYHTVYAVLTNHQESGFYVYNEKDVATKLYSSQKPGIKVANFTTGPKSLKASYTGSSYNDDSSVNVYLQYRKKGGKWTTCSKAMSSSMKTISKKLKAKKTYQVRFFFGKKGKHNGNPYFFKGKYSKSKTLKTGSGKKPSIKSIKVSKVKVVPTNLTIWINGMYGIRIYSSSFKMTVRLKKKPGTTGICVGGSNSSYSFGTDYLKGNKKKYTKKYDLWGRSDRVKGQKYKVSVKSYQSKTYGGYSKAASKRVKFK